MKETNLILEIEGKGTLFAPFSARTCTQSLTPIPQGNLRRTINGKLVWIGSPTHQKYHSIISCTDHVPPAFDGLWKGSQVKVSCLQTLTHPIPEGRAEIDLERDPASLLLIDHHGKPWKVDCQQHITPPQNFPGGFAIYAPRLVMMVENFKLDLDEWGLKVGWTLELVEV